MHQVFLGTAKTLSKMLFGEIKGTENSKLESSTKSCHVATEIKYSCKSIKNVKFWKAHDFKLFFFHTGPLSFKDMNSHQNLLQSFLRLSVAIKILYKKM